MNQYQKVNEETGEISWIIRSMEGNPKQYRFNAQTGQFNINGDTPLLGKDKKAIKEFTIYPIAFRFFQDTLFGRDKSEYWAELFFIDDKNCVSSIMFNNTNAKELESLTREMFYDDVSLTTVSLTARPEKIEGKEGKSWFICRFSYEFQDEQKTKDLKEYEGQNKVFRKDTITDTAVHFLYEGRYFNELINSPKNVSQAESQQLLEATGINELA